MEDFNICASFLVRLFYSEKNPPSRIRTSDLRMPDGVAITVLRSTNWAIGGDEKWVFHASVISVELIAFIKRLNVWLAGGFGNLLFAFIMHNQRCAGNSNFNLILEKWTAGITSQLSIQKFNNFCSIGISVLWYCTSNIFIKVCPILHCLSCYFFKIIPKKRNIIKLKMYMLLFRSQSFERSWNRGIVTGDCQNYARYLMELPANYKTPTKFADLILERMSAYKGIDVIVRFVLSKINNFLLFWNVKALFKPLPSFPA